MINKYKYGHHKPWRERVHILAVKQENGEYWIKVNAANCPKETPPMLCLEAGQVVMIEEVESQEWLASLDTIGDMDKRFWRKP